MHLNKGDHRELLHMISGSIAFGALARSVLFLGTHGLSERKSIDCIKHNLARGKPEPVEFALDDGFKWVGIASELTAEAIRMSRIRANKGIAGEGAESYLLELLREGPVNSTKVYSQARDRGIAQKTLQRAKDRLGVIARKRGMGEGSIWTWELPGEGEDGQRPSSKIVVDYLKPLPGPVDEGSLSSKNDYVRRESVAGFEGGHDRDTRESDSWGDSSADDLERYADKGLNET
jgi:hypothetical protein